MNSLSINSLLQYIFVRNGSVEVISSDLTANEFLAFEFRMGPDP